MSKIALDFGTSNTVLARLDDATGQVRSIELSGVTTPVTCRLEAGGRTETVHVVPSMLHYTEREILIGRQVADRGLPRDPQTFQWIKRRLAMGARKRRKTVRGHVDPLTAGTDFLNTLISYAANEVSLADDEFTFTAPVEAFEDFEDWLRRVAEDLGIRRLRIVDEATAAILAYQGAVRAEDRFLVFDFGCGTLDASAVRLDLASVSSRKAVQLGRAGRDLGGLDIDLWLADDFASRHGLDRSARRRIEADLLAEAERVKIALSDPQCPTSELSIELSSVYQRDCPACERGSTLAAPSTGAGCLGCILEARDFTREIRRTVDRALENAAIQTGLRRDEITRVVMTGGTSLVPRVRRYLEDSFPGAVEYHNPFAAVAQGACDGFVVPLLQHDYAIESYNREARDYEFKPLYKSGTAYPTKPGSVRFWARGSYNGMTRIGLKIFEVSSMPRRSLDVSIVDEAGAFEESSRVKTENQYICLNRENPTFILADPPVDLERDGRRFLCSFTIDGHRRLLVTVEDLLNRRTLLADHPVVRL